MSQDLRIKHICPHQVVEEWLQIENDRQTLRPIQPPASTRVTVLKNRVPVPPTGVYSKVKVTGQVTQPYEIEAGDNDTLSFRVNNDPVQSVTLPVGGRVRASDVVTAIREQATGITVENAEGRIVLTLDRSGPEAALKFEGGNGHTTLGLPTLRYLRSRLIIPGWDLVRDERSQDTTARVIRFHSAMRSLDDVYEISYTTQRRLCRRCLGLGVENDLRHDQQGDPVFVVNETLMLQEIEKILFTIRGSHAFHSWYGSTISELIGSKIIGGGQLVETQLTSEISNTLERYRAVKEQQSQYQPVTNKEMIEQVVSVDVRQDASDPTVFYVAVELRSRAGEINIVEDTIVLSEQTFAEGFQFIT